MMLLLSAVAGVAHCRECVLISHTLVLKVVEDAGNEGGRVQHFWSAA